jgi:hypothetical protein
MPPPIHRIWLGRVQISLARVPHAFIRKARGIRSWTIGGWSIGVTWWP